MVVAAAAAADGGGGAAAAAVATGDMLELDKPCSRLVASLVLAVV